MTLATVRTSEELNVAVAALARDVPHDYTVGFVPTMGALHAGHLSLIDRSTAENDITIVSIFVNPLQFGPHEDFDHYPRTLPQDQELLQETATDILFLPEISTMYPGLNRENRASLHHISIKAGPLGELYEGKTRPGHFDGMLTVVAKLFHLCRPRTAYDFTAYLGQKDAQQAQLVQAMARDLNFPVNIKLVDTVRSPLPQHIIDEYPSPAAAYAKIPGIALSSRNRYLDAEEQDAALVLAQALKTVYDGYHDGKSIDLTLGTSLIAREKRVRLDYFDVVDAATFIPLPRERRNAVSRATVDAHATNGVLAIVAAAIGTTRLLDNLWVIQQPSR